MKNDDWFVKANGDVIHANDFLVGKLSDRLSDIDKEIERLEKESGRLAGEIKRASGMLANPKFVDKAPAAKVEEEKAKLAKYTEMKAQVEERLAQLKK